MTNPVGAGSEEDLDEYVEKALAKSQPTWWTTELEDLRGKMKIAERNWKKMSKSPTHQNDVQKKHDTQVKHDAYKKCRKIYFKEIKKIGRALVSQG